MVENVAEERGIEMCMGEVVFCRYKNVEKTSCGDDIPRLMTGIFALLHDLNVVSTTSSF